MCVLPREVTVFLSFSVMCLLVYSETEKKERSIRLENLLYTEKIEEKKLRVCVGFQVIKSKSTPKLGGNYTFFRIFLGFFFEI